MGAFFHPEENKYIVALGESTAITPILQNLRHKMLSDPVGTILREATDDVRFIEFDLFAIIT